jgi:hypothetical protein
MAKSKTGQQRELILELLRKNRGAVVGLAELAAHVKLPPAQVLTILGQLKDEVECVSKATMHEEASMRWTDVDSKWKLKGPAPAKPPIAWPARPAATDPAAAANATADELRARLGGGTGRERLLAAAWAGHAPAREAAGDAPSPPDDLEAWALGFLRFPKPAAVVAAHAAVRAALAPHEAMLRMDSRPRRAHDAVGAWLASPSRDGATACTAAGIQAEKSAESVGPRAPKFAAAARAAYHAALLAWSVESGADPARQEAAARDAIRAAANAAEPSAIRDAVREAVVAWALA